MTLIRRNEQEPMKETPIGKLFEMVNTGRVYIRYEIDTPQGCISTVNQSSMVIFSDSIDEKWVENQALADAIRERCKG